MGKLLKVVGWIIGLTLLLVVAAVLILPQVIDPNDYKEEIVARVKEQTGRDMVIDGRIELSVFPWLGVETGAVSLGNAAGFGEQPFAAVKSAAVSVKLLPLLSRELEVATITLQGLQLNLIRLKDGTGNWEDLAGTDQPPADKEKKRERPTTESDGKQGLAGLSIGGIDISDANIVWDDRSSGQRIAIEQFRLNSGAVVSNKPVDLELGLTLHNKEPAVTAKLELEGVVALDKAAEVISVNGLRVKLDASGDALPGGTVQAVLEAAASAALSGSQIDISSLKLNAGELQLSGNLKGEALDRQPELSGNLELAEFNLRKWMGDHAMSLPPMADPNTLTRVAARVKLQGEGGMTRMDDLMLRLDESQLNGSASLRGSAIGFNLNLDTIDVDRYLPQGDGEKQQEKSESAKSGSTKAAAKSEESLLPVETLRKLNIDGVMTVGRLTINKLLMEQVKLILKAKDGQLSLDQQVGRFYQGGYQGVAAVDARGKVPKVRADAAANGIQLGPLLKDISGNERLTGKGRFSAKLNTQGNSTDAFKRSLAGNLDFRFEDGALKGINAAKVIREAKARLKGETISKSGEPEQTDFSELSGSGVITSGVIRNRDLLAKSPYLRVTGAGDVDLVQERLDYLIEAVVVKSAKGQGGEGLEELEGIVIPVRLTGPLASPNYKVNWEKVLLESQKGKVKEQIQEKLEDKLKDKKLPGGLQDALKGLFN